MRRRGYRQRSPGAAGGGAAEMRYCLGFVKEVCCARGFKVGGERNMCCGRRRGTEVGGQSNDSAAAGQISAERMATGIGREPRNMRGGYWFPEAKTLLLRVSFCLSCNSRM